MLFRKNSGVDTWPNLRSAERASYVERPVVHQIINRLDSSVLELSRRPELDREAGIFLNTISRYGAMLVLDHIIENPALPTEDELGHKLSVIENGDRRMFNVVLADHWRDATMTDKTRRILMKHAEKMQLASSGLSHAPYRADVEDSALAALALTTSFADANDGLQVSQVGFADLRMMMASRDSLSKS